MIKQLVTFLFVTSITSCTSQLSQETTSAVSPKTDSLPATSIISFETLRTKYDTLIPIFDGLFITHTVFKWGVIDSSGQVVVPFACDGVGLMPGKKGIASVFKSSHSLNTGVPRYMYEGEYFFFDKNGKTEKKGGRFEIKIIGLADFHSPEFVISHGPGFYLPDVKGDTVQEQTDRYSFPQR